MPGVERRTARGDDALALRVEEDDSLAHLLGNLHRSNATSASRALAARDDAPVAEHRVVVRPWPRRTLSPR